MYMYIVKCGIQLVAHISLDVVYRVSGVCIYNVCSSSLSPQPPFIPGSSPFLPMSRPPPPLPPRMMCVPQPPSTPDKLQGEPWDFHSPTPGALYGAIGSGLPSNAASQPYSQSSFSLQVSSCTPLTTMIVHVHVHPLSLGTPALSMSHYI